MVCDRNDLGVASSGASPGLFVRIINLEEAPSFWQHVEEIFFEASNTQDFESMAARKAFSARWLGRYLELDRDNIFLAVSDDRQLHGYLTGCLESAAAADLYNEFDYFSAFDAHYKTYPAHFHMNVHKHSRDQGVGARLVEAFINYCLENGVPGVHVVTARQTRNVRFYKRCGFEPIATTILKDRELLLLARKLA